MFEKIGSNMSVIQKNKIKVLGLRSLTESLAY